MRVITKEYKEQLKNNETYQFIMNHPKPDFTELDKLEDSYEDEIFEEYEKRKSAEKVVESK